MTHELALEEQVKVLVPSLALAVNEVTADPPLLFAVQLTAMVPLAPWALTNVGAVGVVNGVADNVDEGAESPTAFVAITAMT